MKNILITGGSGLVGTRLTELLISHGYQVAHLSRSSKSSRNQLIQTFQWDIENGYIDPLAFEFADAIVHLAGAGVAEKRWTEERKKEILDSRVLSTRLLYDCLKTQNHHVEAFISASAIGIYGSDTGEALMTEESKIGNSFLSNVVAEWESEVQHITTLNIRTCLLRIGIVLSEKGGALVEMAKPIKMYAGSSLGSGKQIVSWIHIDDLCAMFIFALKNTEISGVFNAVAPQPVSNNALTKSIAQKLNKPLFLPNVPAFAMYLILGEMAEVVLGGNKVSSQKIVNEGFEFQYPSLSLALDKCFNLN